MTNQHVTDSTIHPLSFDLTAEKRNAEICQDIKYWLKAISSGQNQTPIVNYNNTKMSLSYHSLEIRYGLN